MGLFWSSPGKNWQGKIRINTEDVITIEADCVENLTCGDVIAKARMDRQNGTSRIVSLYTQNENNVLDYLLSKKDTQIALLENQTKIWAHVYNPKSTTEEYAKVREIASGGFSTVYLGELYAMKEISRKVGDKLISSEIAILKMVTSCPFIPKVYSFIETEDTVSIVMEYCPGNELYHLLNQVYKLNESQARFYVAEIILALEYIHSLGILYTDLKPENILFDIEGHIKIVDFGLARLASTCENPYCGSNDYLSPEVIRREACTPGSVFYSLGAILYEMVTGYPPHYSINKEAMHFAVLTKKVKMPKGITKECKSLLKGLLNKKALLRLGARGAGEIKKHKWFKGLDWEKLKRKEVEPPFRPSIKKSLWYDANYSEYEHGDAEISDAEDEEMKGYECYSEDNRDTAEELDLVLTKHQSTSAM